MLKKEGRKGQVTIFIIIAIIIVSVGALLYFFVPSIRNSIGTRIENPNDFIDTCVKDKLRESVELVSANGGSIEPEHTVNYKGEEIEYLCYTNRDFVLCSVEQPFLRKHIEEEIYDNIRDVAVECFGDLEKVYRNRGYDVNLEPFEMKVELLPKRVVVTFNSELVLTKGETERYEQFVVFMNNNLYELVGIANSILEKETLSGIAQLDFYRSIYGQINFERNYLADETKIYSLTDRTSGDKFRFASRSLTHGPGIGNIPGIS